MSDGNFFRWYCTGVWVPRTVLVTLKKMGNIDFFEKAAQVWTKFYNLFTYYNNTRKVFTSCSGSDISSHRPARRSTYPLHWCQRSPYLHSHSTPFLCYYFYFSYWYLCLAPQPLTLFASVFSLVHCDFLTHNHHGNF